MKWSSKTSAIVAKTMMIKHRNQRVVIFTQFPQFIDIICQCLTVNRIGFVNTEQRNQNKNFGELIDFWKKQPNLTALLLNPNKAADGLTLVEASNVIIAEPLLNPAQHSQALSRVHRIGQRASVCSVYNFFVADTIEEKIHANGGRIAYDDNLSASLAKTTSDFSVDLLEGVFNEHAN